MPPLTASGETSRDLQAYRGQSAKLIAGYYVTSCLGRLQYAIKYCAKVRKIGPAG